MALVSGAALTWRRSSPTARNAAVGAQVFAAAGVCVGLFTIAVGVGQRTAPDAVYDVEILAVLLGGLAVARRPSVPMSFGARSSRT